jgi:hypothetical protein
MDVPLSELIERAHDCIRSLHDESGPGKNRQTWGGAGFNRGSCVAKQ